MSRLAESKLDRQARYLRLALECRKEIELWDRGLTGNLRLARGAGASIGAIAKAVDLTEDDVRERLGDAAGH